MMPMTTRRRLAAVSLLVTLLIAPTFAATRDNSSRLLGPHDLWRVVTYLCVPSARIGLALPCADVHFAAPAGVGWAELIVGDTHVLTVPLAPITGIESPLALKPESAAYWQAAWGARKYIEAAVGHALPREAIALAINSARARTQDQFHIHTSCVLPAVSAVLANESVPIGANWVRLNGTLAGRTFLARRFSATDLSSTNVIDLLPSSLTHDPVALARQTIVVVGATFDGRAGFYVLSAAAQNGGIGQGEALLDPECRIAKVAG